MKHISLWLSLSLAATLVISGCAKRASAPDDSAIVSAVDAKLYQNPDLKSLQIGVASHSGIVTLTGTVGTPVQKLAIEGIALQTPGVQKVLDQLEVNAAAAASAATAPASTADAETENTAANAPKPREHRSRHARRELAQNANPQQPPDASANQAAGEATGSTVADAAASQPASQAAPAPAAPPPPVQVTIPAGTTLAVRLIDPISSASAQQGQTYAASLLSPVVANGRVVIPTGSGAKVQVVEVKSAGHYQGQSELRLQLQSVSLNGSDYPVQTGVYTKTGASRGKNTAEKVGGGAGLGALLGAVIGHGKGAGIGAVIGGAAGAIDQTATHGQQVTLPSETEINFTLKAPLSLTLSDNS